MGCDNPGQTKKAENMDMGIKGRWALVCGASKGLGLGCARALALEGVHVVMAVSYTHLTLPTILRV